MLAKYLKDLRQAKVVSAAQAVGTLGAGWTASESGAVSKEFMFDDFIQASNFMNRYAAYCSSVNHTPEWSNVYNKVNVTLLNSEFSGVTEKEVQIGEYLNMVSTATINLDVDDDMTIEKITEGASLDVQALLNDQNQPTSLFQVDEGKQSARQVPLIQ